MITNSEKITIKATFLAPWSDIPNAQFTTFTRQLDRHQIEWSDNGVIITNDEIVVHSVQEMYVYSLFKARFLDDWEKKSDKSWNVTLPLFTIQFNKE